MSRSLDDLVPEMKVKALNVKKYCAERGVDLLIYYTRRTLEEQAKLFRSSFKDPIIINTKIAKLEQMGYGYLAKVIKDVGPQKFNGWVTSAGPGESFHNYGMAIDAVPTRGDKCMWDYEDYEEEWNIYIEACESEGLTCGARWNKKDYPHAQLYKETNPLRLYTPEEIKKMLQL